MPTINKRGIDTIMSLKKKIAAAFIACAMTLAVVPSAFACRCYNTPISMKIQVFSRNSSIYSFLYGIYSYCVFHLPLRECKKPPRFPITETGAVIYFIGAFSSAHAITCGGS